MRSSFSTNPRRCVCTVTLHLVYKENGPAMTSTQQPAVPFLTLLMVTRKARL